MTSSLDGELKLKFCIDDGTMVELKGIQHRSKMKVDPE